MATKYRAPNGLRPFYLGEWLIALGVTQDELATRMETNKENVTRWLNGSRPISLDVISAAADALLSEEPQMRDAGILFQRPAQLRAKQVMQEAAKIILENEVLTLPSAERRRPNSRRLPPR
jgi:transcriptional regulator with XRE-family HTH domain